MDKPRLYGTPLSHFTRKLRVLLAELEIDFEWVRPTSLLASTPEPYGDNPLMRVPTLDHRGTRVVDSDHIARYLVGIYDPADRFGVCTRAPAALNRLAVANGIMANEVVLILARRGGLADLDSVAYFRKLARGIESGLAWLDAQTDPEAAGFDYADIATLCMWQHVVHYALVPELDLYARIDARVARFAERASVASTTPRVSLAQAEAEGWTPAP